MAITWNIKITVISISTKEISLVATKMDDVTGDVKTYFVPKAPIGTAAQKIAIMDEIWEKYQVDLAKESDITTFIGTLEIQAKTNLEARE